MSLKIQRTVTGVDRLYFTAGALPSLDQRFAEDKSLVDHISGQNLITFTRASSATFVGSDGVLQTAVTNLCLHSEEFDIWNTNSGTTVTTNATASPAGTTTADKIVETTANTAHYRGRLNVLAANTTCTLSVYVKAGERNFVGLQLTPNGTDYIYCTFNIQTGVASTPINAGNGSGATASIQAVNNGWYRCVLTGIPSSTAANPICAIYVGNANVNFVTNPYLGDGTSGIYLWGAQLQQSSTVGEYVPTGATINSAPRFDHNPVTGESLGLLVEEQRTNLLVRSEEFENAYWFKSAATITSNATTAPNGTTTADKLVETAVSAEHIAAVLSMGLASNVYTVSVFAKAAERTQISIFLDTGITRRIQYFNLSTGTLGTNSGGLTSSIQAFADGWYRCSVTLNAAETLLNVVYTTALSGSNNYLGNASSGVFLWGAQLEAGAFPTSYIPTTTAAVTRAADIASITGGNFSSWYRQDEGTVFAGFAVAQPASGGNQFVFRANDNSLNNNTTINIQASGFASFATAAGGIFDGTTAAALALSANTAAKFAGAYVSNNLGISLNGATTATDPSATMPTTLNRLDIGSDHIGSNPIKAGHIRRLTYFPQRLPNSVLQSLTS